ncbi:hypothetical protein AWC38_SpisGene15815 [Stylophora pistillata]|uniref:Uncharacterized protein n=1 Tax=Stylophora pistillata TaxID=50429 RepID=A0A2B4RQ94_STYPI|nr:hypothetical protein AWC38_SpisGene15815 [Stylophora pistillata]
MPYVRTKASTKQSIEQKAQQYGPKRALFEVTKEAGGVCDVDRTPSCDGERALINALGAGFQRAAPLLCYLHRERNVRAKGRKLGLPSALVERICQDLYRQGSGLIWSSSRQAFDARAKVLLQEWDTLERSERGGPPMFVEYFRATSWKICRPGWQEMDKFNISVYDFVESFDQEEELAWCQLPHKWEVCAQFQHHLSSKSHGEMTLQERKAFMQNVDKVCPDPAAYKRPHSFQFRAATCTTTSASKNVGAKVPSRKRPLDDDVMGSHSQVEDRASGSPLQAEVLNPTTLVIRKSVRPDDPPSGAPLVLKETKRNIIICRIQ